MLSPPVPVLSTAFILTAGAAESPAKVAVNRMMVAMAMIPICLIMIRCALFIVDLKWTV